MIFRELDEKIDVTVLELGPVALALRPKAGRNVKKKKKDHGHVVCTQRPKGHEEMTYCGFRRSCG